MKKHILSILVLSCGLLVVILERLKAPKPPEPKPIEQEHHQFSFNLSGATDPVLTYVNVTNTASGSTEHTSMTWLLNTSGNWTNPISSQPGIYVDFDDKVVVVCGVQLFGPILILGPAKEVTVEGCLFNGISGKPLELIGTDKDAKITINGNMSF